MVLRLELRKVGDSVGVVLPDEALAHLHAGEGDAVYLTEAPDGALRLTPARPEFAEQMQIAESVIGRYRNALKDLAK